jgi:hypothetical protein
MLIAMTLFHHVTINMPPQGEKITEQTAFYKWAICALIVGGIWFYIGE